MYAIPLIGVVKLESIRKRPFTPKQKAAHPHRNEPPTVPFCIKPYANFLSDKNVAAPIPNNVVNTIAIKEIFIPRIHASDVI